MSFGFCVFCGCFPVVAKEDVYWRFSDSYVEIGLSVVVDRGRGPTTTNHEGLTMMVTCDTKQVNKMIRTELVVIHYSRKSDKYF